MDHTLDQPVTQAHQYAKRLARPLKRLGLVTIRDLLWYTPTRHDDLREATAIAHARVGASVVIRGTVADITNRRAFRKHMMVTEAVIRDRTGSMRCVWFQQPHIAHSVAPGAPVIVAGKVVADRYGIHLASPIIERERATPIHTGRIVPIYSLTYGITQKQLRYLVFELISIAAKVVDALPPSVREREGLMALADALRSVHFPDSLEELERAKRRLAFDEMVAYFRAVAAARQDLAHATAPHVAFDEHTTRTLVAALPFRLTGAQRRAAWEVLRDMAGGHIVTREQESRRTGEQERDGEAHVLNGKLQSGSARGGNPGTVRPMQRLLNGDVGSGKTVVAAIAAANVARAGFQAAYLAPTEVLAVQQAAKCTSWLAPLGVRVALWTRVSRQIDGAPVTAAELRRAVATGTVDVVIGTHAILTSTAQFHRLALAIVDEQHRFGVSQRAALRANVAPPTDASDRGQLPGAATVFVGPGRSGEAPPALLPHLLSMTATPIPRTLSLTLLGDLSVSVLDELPAGRSPVTTAVVEPNQRPLIARAIREACTAGHQVFVVCPTIDATEEGGTAAVETTYERACAAFPNARVALLHGRMRTAAQRSVMEAFARREVDILVSTTVIEVGVDQPNATVMVVEDADRFGLAQLHQLRGRVGRGEAPGSCFLATSNAAPARLRTLEATTDGFTIAEVDLKERGPGAIVGTAQSGWPAFRFATMDTKFFRRAQAVAAELEGACEAQRDVHHLE